MKRLNIKHFLFTLLLSLVSITTSAHDIVVTNAGNTIYYSWINNNTELEVSYRGNSFKDYSNEYSGDVVIPESVSYNGTIYPVTSIGYTAFDGCTTLTSVTIPNSVTSIGDGVFGGCSGLKSVTIPNSVTRIGNDAFNSCSGLTSVTIPNSVISIGIGAFSHCSGLTSLTIPNSVTDISACAFQYCSSLISVTISNSVTWIGNDAFSNCSTLESVTFGTGILTIGKNVFELHKPAKVIWLAKTPPSGYNYAEGTLNYVPNDQYSLPNMTVYPHLSSMFETDGIRYVPINTSERICDAIDCLYDERAENVRIDKLVNYRGVQLTVNKVNQYTCYKNPYIKQAEFSLDNKIDDYVFAECIELTNVALGNNVTDIGSHAFEKCSSLSEIDIPNSVTSVSDFSFSDCSNLQTVTIGNGVITIGNNAFSGCSSLANLILGNSVENIGIDALSGCSAITKIVSYAPNPPVCGTGALTDINKWDCTLCIPKGKTASYLAADQWNEFFVIDEISEDDETDQTFVFVDEQGNVVSDGTVITVNSINAEGQMVIPLKVKNVEGNAAAVSMYETIDGMPNGSWQTCAFGNCMTLSATGYSAKNIISGTDACDIQTEWMPEQGNYASWTATLQIHLFNIITKTVFGVEQQVAGDEIIGYGPKVTINFVYDDNVVLPEKCATPTIAYTNGKLQFTCETEGVEFVPSISLIDTEMESNNEVDLFSVYRFNVYAKKEGYADSDVATMDIDFNRLNGDMNHDGQISIADATAIVNIILNDITVIDPEQKFYYSVGTEKVTRTNYTTVNNAQYKLEFSEIPEELDLSAISQQQAVILLPEGCIPIIKKGQNIVTTTSVSLGNGYSVYTTTTAINGAECTCTVYK